MKNIFRMFHKKNSIKKEKSVEHAIIGIFAKLQQEKILTNIKDVDFIDYTLYRNYNGTLEIWVHTKISPWPRVLFSDLTKERQQKIYEDVLKKEKDLRSKYEVINLEREKDKINTLKKIFKD
ncbi:MAG: hypothetical protein PHX21_13545 [bacterium]|nr:hypothetical protein [bacterium]